jgi:solute carrier family 40 (iron-regulated transporter), member 1
MPPKGSKIATCLQNVILTTTTLLSVALIIAGGSCFSGNPKTCPPTLHFLKNKTSNHPYSNHTTNTTTPPPAEQSYNMHAGIPMFIIGIILIIPSTFVTCCIGKEPSDTDSLRFLYGSHFMSAWGDRMWQMAVPLFLIDIFKSTLLPTGLYAAFVYLLNVFLLPRLGIWVDKSSRIYVQRVGLIIENLSVALTSVVICSMVIFIPDLGLVEQTLFDKHVMFSYVLLLLLGGVGELFNGVQSISIEKDWVVVMSKESNLDVGILNTTLRRIDLSCKALAPLAFTAVYQFIGDDIRTRIFYGALMIGFWNVISFPVELILNTRVYESFPRLHMKVHTHDDGTTHIHENGHRPHKHYIHKHADGTEHYHDGSIFHVHDEHGEVVDLDDPAQTRVVGSFGIDNHNSHNENSKENGCCANFFTVYWKHPIFSASLSYTLLWMTVLDNGALMTSYLQWRGVPPVYFGFSRGLGAVFGLCGTSVFLTIKFVFKSIERSGLIAIWLFWLILFPGVVSFYIAGESKITDYILMGSMAAGRIGLWSYDLVITQLTQDNVVETERGAFSSFQRASYQLFYVFIQVLGMIFHDPRQFIILVTYSTCVVLGAALVYTQWYLFRSNAIRQKDRNVDGEEGLGYERLIRGSNDNDDA